MTSHAASSPRMSRGFTLLELMIGIVCGMILVLAAFKVLADFEGGKRTTTAMNDAMQSGNLGVFEIEKLIHSAGSGMAAYANLVSHVDSVNKNEIDYGYGCALNYTPTGGSLITSGVIGSTGLPAPFSGVVGTAAAPLRLVPAIIFGSALPALGTSDGSTAATSDALMLMLGGAGYGEVPVQVGTGLALQSIVGFGPGDWVVDAGTSLGDCMVSQVSSTFTMGGPGKSNWTSSLLQLPLATGNTVGNKTLTVGDYIFDLGNGTAANFLLYGVDSGSATLRSVDLLNSIGASLNVSDDVVFMKAVYEVDPDNTGSGNWVPASGAGSSFTAGSGTYNYSATSGTDCLLCGTNKASTALWGIKAIRVALIVRAPIEENANQAQNANINFSAQSYPLFGSLPSAVRYTWYPPQGTSAQPQNYRYKEIETTIPIRNNGLL
jgi:hypothetical protein